MSNKSSVAPNPSSTTQTTSRITARPNPAPAGSKITICYDFDGATSPVTLSLAWDPSQQPDTITLTDTDNCKTVKADQDAQGLVITDESGQSGSDAVVFT